MSASPAAPVVNLRRVLVPLALAQFICSFAGSNMNVMINDISEDLDTTVQGVQITITLFLLVMAALMIPGGKLTDRYGRKRMLHARPRPLRHRRVAERGLARLGILILGNSILEGVGTAMLIPPVYILTTMLFTGVTARARAFGAISASGGVGAAAGPADRRPHHLRAQLAGAFVFQALIIAVIVVLSRRIVGPVPPDPTRPFDTRGAVLSAVGLVLLVHRHPRRGQQLWLMLGLMAAGALVLVVFFRRYGPRSAPARSRCCRRACSATARRTSASSPRTRSG